MASLCASTSRDRFLKRLNITQILDEKRPNSNQKHLRCLKFTIKYIYENDTGFDIRNFLLIGRALVQFKNNNNKL